MGFDPHSVRGQFPALRREIDGRPVSYLDGPGGTQSPESVIDAMAGYLRSGSSNLGGPFLTSREADDVTEGARQCIADLFNARRPDEIVFGQNMTSLTFAMSRALAETWNPGDEIVLTRLDHDANVAPWLLAARDADVTVRWVGFEPDTGMLAYGDLAAALGQRTRLVAVTHASNAIGSIVDVARVTEMAHGVGALVYVDAVHYAPHGQIDVQRIDCDFLVASAYKFFGPHTGILYGKYDLLAGVDAYKVRPSPSLPAGKWETGTQSFESLAGVAAAVEYLASIGAGEGLDRKRALIRSYDITSEYEQEIARRFLEGAARIEGVKVYGTPDVTRRTPTFAISVAGVEPADVAAALGASGIFVWSGHYYAVEVMDHLDVSEQGGLVRIGFVHYNTMAEVDRVLKALTSIAAGEPIDVGPGVADFSGAQDLSPYEAYTLTDLPDPRTVGRSSLAAGLLEIVNVEGPMTTDRAYSVFIKSSGGKKVTRTVRDDLDWALESLVDSGAVEVVDIPAGGNEVQRVVRRVDQPHVRLREMGERDLYKVPLNEVAAVLVGVKQSVDPGDDEELFRAVLDVYGLKRLTPLAEGYLAAAKRHAGW